MALLAGQTYNTNCPYFWAHCTRNTCDGCVADQHQNTGQTPPPWAEGTTIDQRHATVRAAAAEPGTARAVALWSTFTGWK